MSQPQCIATTKTGANTGRRCGNKATIGSQYCNAHQNMAVNAGQQAAVVHSPRYRGSGICKGITATGTQCTRGATVGDYCADHAQIMVTKGVIPKRDEICQAIVESNGLSCGTKAAYVRADGMLVCGRHTTAVQFYEHAKYPNVTGDPSKYEFVSPGGGVARVVAVAPIVVPRIAAGSAGGGGGGVGSSVVVPRVVTLATSQVPQRPTVRGVEGAVNAMLASTTPAVAKAVASVVSEGNKLEQPMVSPRVRVAAVAAVERGHNTVSDKLTEDVAAAMKLYYEKNGAVSGDAIRKLTAGVSALAKIKYTHVDADTSSLILALTEGRIVGTHPSGKLMYELFTDTVKSITHGSPTLAHGRALLQQFLDGLRSAPVQEDLNFDVGATPAPVLVQSPSRVVLPAPVQQVTKRIVVPPVVKGLPAPSAAGSSLPTSFSIPAPLRRESPPRPAGAPRGLALPDSAFEESPPRARTSPPVGDLITFSPERVSFSEGQRLVSEYNRFLSQYPYLYDSKLDPDNIDNAAAMITEAEELRRIVGDMMAANVMDVVDHPLTSAESDHLLFSMTEGSDYDQADYDKIKKYFDDLLKYRLRK